MEEGLSLAYQKLFGVVKEDLTESDLEKARNELNETDDRKQSELTELRKLISENGETEIGQKIQQLFGKKSDAEILRFLRARKFDSPKAYTLMEGYIKFREHYPEISQNLLSNKVKNSLENGYPGLLPFRNKEGHIVLLFSIGTWDSKDFSFDTVLQGYILLLEQLLENEAAQINGFIIIENFKHYSMAQAFSLRPSDLKKMVEMLQGAFPARFKGVHFLYQPWYFTWTYAIVKPFLKKKLADRVHVHGYNLENFHALFDPEFLPEEFGGSGPSYDPSKMTEELYNAIEKRSSIKGDNSTVGNHGDGDDDMLADMMKKLNVN